MGFYFSTPVKSPSFKRLSVALDEDVLGVLHQLLTRPQDLPRQSP
jgi:hypothetical protein